MAAVVDLLSCGADELASCLLTNRFENNALDTASFLLQCTSTLPNAEQISAQLMGEGGDEEMEEEKKEEEDVPAAAPTTSVHVLPLPPFVTKEQSALSIEVSCTAPRGKFMMQLHRAGVVLTNPKKAEETLSIPAAAVDDVIMFRKMEEYKKMKQSKQSMGKPLPGHTVLVCFKENANVMFKNKELKQVCLQLPFYSSDNYTEKQWWDGFKEALCGDGGNIIRVCAGMDHPGHDIGECYTFQSEGASGSSTTTEGMPCIGCYHGINDGVLFPLREGLLFFKPPLFVHRSKLASISCGRGSGSASRYVDMTIQLDSEKNVEFTNIAREELGVVNDYIHKTLIPAMQADADGADSEEEGAVAVEVVTTGTNSDNDDDNEEEEQDDESDGSGGKRRRPSRAASRTARAATKAHFDRGVNEESDDDEEDFQSDDGSDSDSGSEADTDEEAVQSSDDEDAEMESEEDSEDEVEKKHAKRPRI